METCLHAAGHSGRSHFLHTDQYSPRTSPHLPRAPSKALHHSHRGAKSWALPGQPDLPSCASDASTLRAGHRQHRWACRQPLPASPLGFRSSTPSSSGSSISRGGSGPDVCVRASTSAGAGDGSGDAGLQGSQKSLGDKLQSFVQAFWKFVRPHTIRGTLLGTTALTTRALLENPHLIDWGLLPKALMGLLALLCGNGFIVGINQIYDVEIDVVNKPFLPVAAGELSPALAWALCLGLAAVGVTIVARNFGPLISGLYSLGLLLGTLYSVPPFRLKRSAVAAFLIIATVRGFLLNFGVYYSTRAALGAGFIWSPAITFITTFVTLFAVVIAVTKDLPDVEGDRQNGIETFATRLGVRNTSLAAIGILLANYGAAMFMALKPSLGFKPQVMFTGHALLAVFLLYRARQLELAGYTRNAILAFYQQIWTLFYLEYSMFPFI